MEGNNFKIQGYFGSAIFNGDFESIKKHFEGTTLWGADVLEKAGAKRRLIEVIQRYNKRNPCRVLRAGSQSALVVAPVGKKQYLAYRLKAASEGTVEITPMPFLLPKDKIGIAFILALGFILPVLLTPLVWHNYEQKNLRMSRYYLTSFCHHLESRFAA